MEWNGLGNNETIVEKLFATVLNVLYHTKIKIEPITKKNETIFF